MLSYAKIRSPQSAAAYFARYYAADEAHQRGEPPGRWFGAAAGALGLAGEVRRADLERALEGRHPLTGGPLGAVGRNHVAGHDLTFSAPKSVSTVWAVADPDLRARIETAHERAVAAGLGYMRQYGIRCRLGRGGRTLAAAEPIIATFQHSTSRANDPQLHTHCVVLNRARGPAGDWRGVDIDLRAVHAAGAAYRAELARELRALGFGVERVGQRGECELSGAPAELMRRWSTRRGDVLAELREMRRSDAAAAETAAAVSRRGKESPDRAANFVRWAGEAAEHRFDAVAARELAARGQALERDHAVQATDEEILARAMGNRVAVEAETIRREVMREAVGRIGVGEALAQAERILAGMVRVEREDARGRMVERWTTRELLERERRMLADAARLAADRHHALAREAVEAQIGRAGLRGQQADMVRALTDERGLANVQGWAGTGKTYTVAQVAELYRSAGYEVRGCAVAGRAAQELQAAGIESTTIARLRLDLAAGRTELTARTVLVVDEAGMLGSRDAADLYRRAADAGAKIIQIGDTRQLAPVEAGAPFRDVLRAHGGLELSEVRRQADERDRAIARAVREQRPEHARALMQQGAQWHVSPTVVSAIREMARAYADERAAGRDALMVASLRRDVARLNEEARAALRARGVLRGEEVAVATAQGELRVAAGDWVVFTARCAALGAVNGTRAEVVEASPERLRLRLADGRERDLRLWAAPDLDEVHERAERSERRVAELIERRERLREALAAAGVEQRRRLVSERETLARELSAARRELRAAKAVMLRAEAEHGAARSLVHGHASTIHRAQGATVRGAEQGGGTVHALLRDHRMLDSNAAYVALSRNTGQAHAYVSRAEEDGAVERLREAARLESLADYRPVPDAHPERTIEPIADVLRSLRESDDPRAHHLAEVTDGWLRHAEALREEAERWGDPEGRLAADREEAAAWGAFAGWRSELVREPPPASGEPAPPAPRGEREAGELGGGAPTPEHDWGHAR
ncbi:MobF family relaxase [Vulcaniibacterium gelatinicum]|uniref:MobF family relaxase n=1 Tax=Vulcaniibacterium gelatinicum TaxID=2598725 RepID=UPI0011CC0CE6|nr:MobF family relaxase [Vulcaniibacterium gelatinicum]